MKLEEIYRPIEAELNRVNQLLRFEMEQLAGEDAVTGASSSGNKYDIFTAKSINYLLNQPGKSLRPALVLLSARSLNAEISEALIRIAAAIELIHSSSLVHDDIIDEADKRRDLLSVHKKYGIKAAILIGDVLFSQSFTMVADIPEVADNTKVRVYRILTELTRKMCYGEIFEQKIADDGAEVDRESYLRILEFKTALLMSAACRCGAILAGAGATDEEALASYGLYFGYAYQLVDDYRDGDSIYSGEIDLVALASEFVTKAVSTIEGLSDRNHVASLSDFAHFILAEGQKTRT